MLKRGIDLDPRDAYSWQDLGDAYDGLGKLRLAVNDLSAGHQTRLTGDALRELDRFREVSDA